MKLSERAIEVLEELLEEHDDDVFGMVEEHDNQGICYECGALRDSVEPDAEGYECEECGAHSVGGLTMAMFFL